MALRKLPVKVIMPISFLRSRNSVVFESVLDSPNDGFCERPRMQPGRVRQRWQSANDLNAGYDNVSRAHEKALLIDRGAQAGAPKTLMKMTAAEPATTVMPA